MEATPLTNSAAESDAELWRLVCQGSTSAFETIVRRHQSLVCAVTYSACGDLALSEDLAQETFWAAWRQRASLEQPNHLRAWLCGIARNLAKNAHRRAAHPARATVSPDALAGLPSEGPGPAEEVMSREEESLVWQALGRIPVAYREPLILYYREGRSVAEVAGALALSEDAVKQRLSRGRGMLRARVTGLVEDGLRRSRPGRRFTLTVMAGLAAHAIGAEAALAGVGTGVGAWKAAAPSVGMGGAFWGLPGTLGGFLGGWLGTWGPAQAAPTRRERDAFLRAGRRILRVSVVFVAALFVVIRAYAGTADYLIAWLGWMLAFGAYITGESVRLAREVRRIRADAVPDDPPNQTTLRSGWAAIAARFGDRSYRSGASFLGLPLIEIHLGAPAPPRAGEGPHRGRRVARGWIAIGDDARGVLLAAGSTALGLVALGGRAFGVASFGGVAMGLVAFGGLGVGALGVGGLGVGVYAFGGGAVGWRSAGGLALGWDIACGGGAFAEHGAIGGAAIARDYAIGGAARARYANDEAARTALLDHPFTRFAFVAMGQGRVLDKLAGASKATAPTEGVAAPGRFTLDNGLAVRIRPIPGASRLALLVLYKVGGDHDPRGRSGLAHLAEHLYVTAAAGEVPARTAEAFFRGYPDGCNAQTGDRYTVIATVFPGQDLEKELREAAARMADLRITAADIDRERPRLLDEVANMFGRIPALGAVNLARERIRPTPEGGRKGGLPEDVAAITVDEIRTHWRRYYKPRNAILVLAGAVDEGAASRAVADHFAKLPPGEEAPGPADPRAPQAGVVRESAVPVFRSQSAPVACVAYAAPDPGTEQYAPFLVLAARFWAASGRPGAGGEAGRPTVYFPLLEDPAMLGVSATARPGETPEQAIGRLESFVADAVAPPLRDDERASARRTFAMFLGTAEIPDVALAQNPYGVALALARREQLGVDPAALGRAFDSLTERDLRRAAALIFAPDRRVGVWLTHAE